MDKVKAFYINLHLDGCDRLYDYAACEWINRPASGSWDPTAWRGKGKIKDALKQDKSFNLQVKRMDTCFNDEGCCFTKRANKRRLAKQLQIEPEEQTEAYENGSYEQDDAQGRAAVVIPSEHDVPQVRASDALPFRVLPEYKPGNVVTGSVILRLRDAISDAKELYIEFYGRGTTTRSGYGTTGHRDYKGYEIYTEQKQCLWKTKSDDGFETALADPCETEIRPARSKDLNAGYHELPFTFHIPENALQSVPTILSSNNKRCLFSKLYCNGKKSGANIVWGLKATIRKGKRLGQGNLSAQRGIWLDTAINIAGIPQHFEPQVVVKSLETRHLACWNSGCLTVNATTPKKAFLHGQDIPVHVEVDNQSGHDIKDIKARIEINGKAKSNPKGKFCCGAIKINCTGQEIKSGPVCNGMNPIFDWVIPWDFSGIDKKLLPVGNLAASAMISLQYEVAVYVERGVFKENVILRVPIVIGNVNDESADPTRLDIVEPDGSFVYKKGASCPFTKKI